LGRTGLFGVANDLYDLHDRTSGSDLLLGLQTPDSSDLSLQLLIVPFFSTHPARLFPAFTGCEGHSTFPTFLFWMHQSAPFFSLVIAPAVEAPGLKAILGNKVQFAVNAESFWVELV